MESVWLTPELSDSIIKNEEIFKQTQNVITDIMSNNTDITRLVENMAGVLTSKEIENREKGMKFFTKILKEIPHDYLSDLQIKFISQFYIDRLKDNHRVIPAVIEGYLCILNMVHYKITNVAEFFNILFREVPCQSQVRQDRYNIYLIIQKVMEMNLEYTKSLGPDFVYGVISAMDGERDPRNLLFLFSFLPKFIANVPLGHLAEEMFEVVSCYYPIDFHPAPGDPDAVTRQELADALGPCLCATPEFGEMCLVLLIEKLDSSLRVAKIDSLRLLAESCKTFTPQTYAPFLKTLWASINRELSHKTDEELKMAAHEALSALVANLAKSANTDQTFENFVKGIIISTQSSIAESSTVAQFVQTKKVILTTANASNESCVLIARSMIPAIITYYSFNTSPKLQIATLVFLADLYDIAKYWDVLDVIKPVLKEIPQNCLTAVSNTNKEFQIAGFRTLTRVISVLESDLVVPFVEILIHNIQTSMDNDLLATSVETVHAIARRFPELIMNLVVKGKCDIGTIARDKDAIDKRLNLLCNLASINEFTKLIIEEMLLVITTNAENALQVVDALSISISNTSLYSVNKVAQIESDHGLIDSVITWLEKEVSQGYQESLESSFTLISTTVASLPLEKQENLLNKHTERLILNCKIDESYFLILGCLYESIRQNIKGDYETILRISLDLSLRSDKEVIRRKACVVIAHFLNKADYGQMFEMLYELLKNYLSSCDKGDLAMCPRLIELYGWLTKALILRGSDLFAFWLQKIIIAISSSDYCEYGADSINLIMSDTDCLTVRQHCRISLLYTQRMFQTFSTMTEKLVDLKGKTKEAYLLSWAHILGNVPKSVLINNADNFASLVIESLSYENPTLLSVMTNVLTHLVQTKHVVVARSLQSALPRLSGLATCAKTMDVRIKSLQCLFDIAENYPTVLLLPYKQDILLGLAPSLDDRKRLVRSAAVKARTRWFLIGAPGEAKEN